jgi:transketolase N-terminal domain/subunit
VNSLDYYVYGEAFYKSNLVGYENKIKELLDINALENHLNQAVRIENYAAAADIRNKIEAKGYNIVECHGRLIIRLGSPLAPEGGINKI